MTKKIDNQGKTITKCFNYVSQTAFKEVKDVVDRMQVIHDVAMMLEGYILMNSEPGFVPKVIKEIERDIEKWIEFHSVHNRQIKASKE